MKKSTLLFWSVRILAAIIMLQTLYFKFTGAPESVEIFTKVGMEPWGRFGVGTLELVASILIILPATVWAGALLALGLMGGAIMMHLTILGIAVQNDGGQLFLYAVIVAVCAVISFWVDRKNVPDLIKKMLPSFLQ